MKLKGRTLLVLSLLLFGGYAIFDFFQDKAKESKSIEESRLMTVNFEQVNLVEIVRGDQRIELTRSVDGWELTAPFKDIADNNVVEDFIKNAVPERIIEIAKEGADIDWSVYGLNTPLGKITFTTSGGSKNEFVISEKKNFEGNVFARRDQENRVLVINSIWQNRVKKTPLDLRDRHLFRSKIASVEEIKIKNEKGLIDLKRVDGKWELPSGKKLKLDQNKVREILSIISDSKASEIYDSKVQLPKRKPLFSLQLKRAETTWKAEVEQADDLLIYAQINEMPLKVKLEAGAMDKLITLSDVDLIEGGSENLGKPLIKKELGK